MNPENASLLDTNSKVTHGGLSLLEVASPWIEMNAT